MKIRGNIIGFSLFLLSSSICWAGEFNLHSGNLSTTDKIDVEWRKQSGNCPTKFPITSADCSYIYSNIKGLLATYIDQYSHRTNFSTTNTFLLNIRVNGETFETCQMLQQKIKDFSLVTINKDGCALS